MDQYDNYVTLKSGGHAAIVQDREGNLKLQTEIHDIDTGNLIGVNFEAIDVAMLSDLIRKCQAHIIDLQAVQSDIATLQKNSTPQ